MNEKELRELDAWIAEHVIKPSQPLSGFRPTICPADAMEVLKKCAEKTSMSLSFGSTNEFWIGNLDRKSQWQTEASLELAICLFARKLFTSPNPKHPK